MAHMPKQPKAIILAKSLLSSHNQNNVLHIHDCHLLARHLAFWGYSNVFVGQCQGNVTE